MSRSGQTKGLSAGNYSDRMTNGKLASQVKGDFKRCPAYLSGCWESKGSYWAPSQHQGSRVGTAWRKEGKETEREEQGREGKSQSPERSTVGLWGEHKLLSIVFAEAPSYWPVPFFLFQSCFLSGGRKVDVICHSGLWLGFPSLDGKGEFLSKLIQCTKCFKRHWSKTFQEIFILNIF